MSDLLPATAEEVIGTERAFAKVIEAVIRMTDEERRIYIENNTFEIQTPFGSITFLKHSLLDKAQFHIIKP